MIIIAIEQIARPSRPSPAAHLPYSCDAHKETNCLQPARKQSRRLSHRNSGHGSGCRASGLTQPERPSGESVQTNARYDTQDRGPRGLVLRHAHRKKLRPVALWRPATERAPVRKELATDHSHERARALIRRLSRRRRSASSPATMLHNHRRRPNDISHSGRRANNRRGLLAALMLLRTGLAPRGVWGVVLVEIQMSGLQRRLGKSASAAMDGDANLRRPNSDGPLHFVRISITPPELAGARRMRRTSSSR